MGSIIPHIIIKHEESAIDSLKNDFSLNVKKDYVIVSNPIHAPSNSSQESVDDITDKTIRAFEKLNSIDEAIAPAHVLVKNNIRGRLEHGKPTGYIVELTDNGPVVHSLDHMIDLPLLGGYGSLLDPVMLASNTEDGDLRNSTDEVLKEKIAKDKDIKNKIEYAEVKGIQLNFNRAGTSPRYLRIQTEKNQWACLNIEQNPDAKAYIVLFDAKSLTKNPFEYFARENIDELEYARRRISPKAISHIAGINFNKENGVWILDSPIISDVYGDLEMINTNPDTQISDSYINRITNGLIGAEQMAAGFAECYMKNTIQANGQSLHKHEKFKSVLEEKAKQTI